MRSHGTFGAVSPLEPAELLAAYDAKLRTDAETPGARSVTRLGSLRLVEFGSGRGFITYRELGVLGPAEVAELVVADLAHFEADRQSEVKEHSGSVCGISGGSGLIKKTKK